RHSGSINSQHRTISICYPIRRWIQPDFRSYFLIQIKLAKTVNEIPGTSFLPSRLLAWPLTHEMEKKTAIMAVCSGEEYVIRDLLL
ncbi:Hypothetical protein FKW44_013154, partial [Caligus rogercresseyi]